jgi:hypothetical protein
MRDWRKWQRIETWGLTEDDVMEQVQNNSQLDSIYRPLWSHNVTEAMKHKLPFVSDLYNTKSGPCLVCGAGPSLEHNAEAIRILAALGWDIIATDRALITLRKMGVKELFTVTTECQPECGDMLDCVGTGDVVVMNLISCSETRDKAIKQGATVYHCAPMVPTADFWNWIYDNPDFIGENVGCERPNCIVTFSTLDIAYWMGYDHIVTIGNDLCYEDPFSCSSDGAVFEDGSHGWIRQLADGRWTFGVFEKAAHGFAMFYKWHPEMRGKILDASHGICNLPQINLMDIAEAGGDVSRFRFSYPEQRKVS